MKHARPDYDRIQDPLQLIPDDEPVLLLRGQDEFAAETLEHYASLVRKRRIDCENNASKYRKTQLPRGGEGIVSALGGYWDGQAEKLWQLEKTVMKHARAMRKWPTKKQPDLAPPVEILNTGAGA